MKGKESCSVQNLFFFLQTSMAIGANGPGAIAAMRAAREPGTDGGHATTRLSAGQGPLAMTTWMGARPSPRLATPESSVQVRRGNRGTLLTYKIE